MLLEIFGLLVLAINPILQPELDSALHAPARTWALIQGASAAALTGGAAFIPAERAVSNWRVEAAQRLEASPPYLAKLLGGDALATPRCVKLNNYWCVKRAGWAGEIAADADGHVAFASALEGAVVAVMLLRRYYLVLERRSARAILSRWAPAQCGAVTAGRGRGGVIPLGALTTHGIANTLRARWLASHRPGFAATAPRTAVATGAPQPVKLRRSVVAGRTLKLMPAPEIAVGMGELPSAQTPVKLAALASPNLAARDLAALLPGPACTDESARIDQYAARAIEGVAAGPDDDLRLFSQDGAPGPNLPHVMENMAKVEIGPLAARMDLIMAAIEAEARRARGGPAAAQAQ